MSEISIEDRMLQSAYESFLSLANYIESNTFGNDSIFQITNQMYSLHREILKEVFIQAEFQLECYRCHQKLLLNDQTNLIKSKKTLSEELNLMGIDRGIGKTPNHQELMRIKQNLEELCDVYTAKIENFEKSYEVLTSFLMKIKKDIGEKEVRIAKLSEFVGELREKSTNANNSLSKAGSEKSLSRDLEEKKGIGTFLFGFFRKNLKK